MSVRTEKDPGKSVRLLRIGEQVRHALAALLTEGRVRDEVINRHIISVSEVRVTPDLRLAICFVKPLGGADEAEVLKALRANSKWMRGEIARKLATKITPALKFELDDSFDASAKIDAILRTPHVARDLGGGEPE